ncbi:MAG TPA: glutamine-hydrolyzing carbamoyl-phosphate synthase small subunit [Candidatus Acidoferrales bacterium]|nr:glutamine-hydrolyzing carbamoyl-phosphate synthase small subunit [Candidatus Acidoferrales bacterium]
MLTQSNDRIATLALEDGRIFTGRAAGAKTRRGAEVVFNTSLTGYQEVFTDPSYAGQMVCLTYPHIGNVGANPEDEEAARPYIEGLIVREFSAIASNWRSEESAQAYLERHKIPVIWDLDTRALVRHLRIRGAMRAVLATDGTAAEKLLAESRAVPSMAGLELASRVTSEKRYGWDKGSIELALSPWREDIGEAAHHGEEHPWRVVAYDFGIKQNILRLLVDHNCEVTVVPAQTSAEDVLGLKPDGVFLSNGPGDPEPIHYAVQNIRNLIGRVPVFGICLGHQLCGLALGGKTYKLKFGHHGSNHPVKNLVTNQVEITAQNHGFVVDPESLPSSEVELTHVNLNDHTNEGMRHRSLPLFSVQYHPEASPGPHDSHYLFRQFTEMMAESRGGTRGRGAVRGAAKP